MPPMVVHSIWSLHESLVQRIQRNAIKRVLLQTCDMRSTFHQLLSLQETIKTRSKEDHGSASAMSPLTSTERHNKRKIISRSQLHSIALCDTACIAQE